MAEVDAGASAPVEPVVNAPVANTVPAPESPSPEQANAETAQPEKTYSQKDVEEIVSKRLSKESRRNERESQRLAQQIAEGLYYKRLHEEQQQKSAARPADGRPREEDFQGRPYSEYVEALADWKAEQKLSGFRKETEEQGRQRQREEQAREIGQKLAEGAKKYPDFKEVALADEVPNTQAMAHAIAKVKNPADVAYYLGQNLDEAEQISQLSDIEQVWAIKDLSSKLSATPTPKPVPAPIVPNKGTAPVEVRLEDAGYDDFVKIRERQLAARGKRRR